VYVHRLPALLAPLGHFYMSHVVSLSMLDKNKNWVSPSMKRNRMCNGICFQVQVKERRLHKNKCEQFTLHKKQKDYIIYAFQHFSGLSPLHKTTNAKIALVRRIYNQNFVYLFVFLFSSLSTSWEGRTFFFLFSLQKS
jgi:hypothetical protein